MALDKNYANGWFSKIGKEFDDGSVIWSIGIKPEDFIDWINQLPVNEKGFINLSMAESRNRDKMNLWDNTYDGTPKNNSRSSTTTGNGRQQSRNGGSNGRGTNAGSGAQRQSAGGGNRNAGGATRGRTNTRASQPQEQTDDLPF